MKHDLFQFRINEMTPFMTHADCVYDRLREAHALLLILGNAYRYAPADPCADGSINNINNDIKADAIEAIGTLVALAQYHTEADNAEERAKPAAVAA